MSNPISEAQLTRLVEEVVRQVQDRGVPPHAPGAARGATANMPSPASLREPVPARVETAPAEGVFGTMEEAIAAAEESYRELAEVSLEQRRALIRAMRDAAATRAAELAQSTMVETGFGRAEDKVHKILLAAHKTPGVEDLQPVSYTGDDGLTLVEAAPYGVIGAITPCTNPVPTVVNNTISIIAAGNTVVFNPHPAARGVSNEAVRMLNRAIRGAGGPSRMVCSLAEPTIDSSTALMKHPAIRLLLVTGGGVVVELAMTCGKRCVAAGPGNPPVIVDDTADIAKAGRSIVAGASFDNNVLCTAEKEIFVFETVADPLMAEMKRNGAHEIVGRQLDDLVELVVEPGDPRDHPRKQFIGQNAAALLAQIGVDVGDDVRLVVCEVPGDDHPLVQLEMLMPILPVVRVRDLDEALTKAKRAEHYYRHTAMMHSESVSNMSRVAREIETTIFVKNAPSYAGLGFGGEGFATLSIAGPTGEGLTSARTFTRQRRCVLVDAFRII